MKRIICDTCGKFVSYADLESGKAARYLNTPDSEFTMETFFTFCRDCWPIEQRRKG